MLVDRYIFRPLSLTGPCPVLQDPKDFHCLGGNLWEDNAEMMEELAGKIALLRGPGADDMSQRGGAAAVMAFIRSPAALLFVFFVM